MKASNELFAALKDFEGLRLEAYKPRGERSTGGHLTIGYGHLGAKAGQRITEQQAEALLRADVAAIEQQLARLELSHLKPDQWDAVVDFCYNLGVSAFAGSTLYRKIKSRAKVEEVAAEFRRWVYSGRTKLEGLVRRREWEAEKWGRAARR